MPGRRPPDPGPMPARVIVARVRIVDGNPVIERHAPKRLVIEPGRALVVLLHFQIRESSRDREQFHVLLTSRLDDEEAPEVGRDVRDRRLLDDAQWGYLEQRYAPPAAGEHRLVATAYASYGVEPWGGKGTPHGDHERLVVKIPITVRPLA